ncbi:MAG: type II toxin-antitoxin system YafQ family toxin [Mediterranea sp.]|jgi:mRNA interferase YafQ|nr:type II toxin-antitoxin system YafQ family toxin [Mediterranea sp.]
MRKLKLTGQFKKDLKRIQNNPKKIARLEVVLNLLRTNGSLPEEYSPHLLIGNYKGCMECHVGSDLLLIWIDESQELIKLVRLGSHSELF